MLVLKSSQRSVQSSAASANIEPRPLSQPVWTPRPDASPTKPLASRGRDEPSVRRPVTVQKPIVCPKPLANTSTLRTSHNRNQQPTHLVARNESSTGSEVLTTSARYRHKDSQSKQQRRLELGNGVSRPNIRQSSDSRYPSLRLDTLDVRTSGATTLIQRAGTFFRTSASSLSSVLQSSAAFLWTGSSLGRLALSSSRLFLQHQKGLGFV